LNRANYSRPEPLERRPGAGASARDGGAPLVLTVPATFAGVRLDQALARLIPEHSRSRLKAWIDAGRITLDGAATEGKRRLCGGERIEVVAGPPATELAAAAAQPIALSIVHEDDDILVVDKPAGLVVHPGSGNRDGTLQNALLHHAPELAALPRSGIVHRLDKDTSGLLVVAKTLRAHTDLVRQLQARSVRREYVGVARGDLARPVTIDAPIGRHPHARTTMAVVATGKPARTQVTPVARLGAATLVHCRLETGRTHQIRVHLAAIGHPLIGDPAYGGRRGGAGIPAFPRQALHAARLGLVHPRSHAPCEWEAPMPPDLAQLIDTLSRGQ
jgi:23S rRNA pseudouridine1911/1915/1917 synthase